MSSTIIFVSYSIRGRVNVGAYDQPFSGVGIEFDPLGVTPGRTGITLHESGFLPANDAWNFPAVFSPFWRLYYNARRGHSVLFGNRRVELTPRHTDPVWRVVWGDSVATSGFSILIDSATGEYVQALR